MVKLAILVAVLLSIAPEALAQAFQLDPDMRDQVTFGVTRTTIVENDEMKVVLSATHDDLSAAVAADTVNRTMRAAIERTRGVEDVRFRTGSYSTHRVHPQPSPPSRPREPRWRVEQQLVLTSSDFDALRSLTSELQPSLNLVSVGFTLSQERRIAAERGQSDAALVGFREEAERIREKLGFAGYEIVQLRLSHGGPRPLRRHAPVQMAAEAMSMDTAPVVLEGGSSPVHGHVEARIQLLR